jgi:hypothetical protein
MRGKICGKSYFREALNDPGDGLNRGYPACVRVTLREFATLPLCSIALTIYLVIAAHVRCQDLRRNRQAGRCMSSAVRILCL